MRPDAFTVIPAAYTILRKDDQVLLIRRYNTGYHDGEYSFPAGHIDGAESALTAAVREAKEEVGVTIKESDLQFVHVMHKVADAGDHERVNFFFMTDTWQGEPYLVEPDKCDDVRWFPIDSLPENMEVTTKNILHQSLAGQRYSDAGFSN